MSAFWQLARRMLRYRVLVVAALVAAFVSAAGLGVGLVAIAPILRALIGEGHTLPDMAAGFNDRSPVDIPAGVIEGLPTDEFSAVAVVLGGLCLLTVLGSAANFLHVYLSMTVVQRTIARLRREVFDVVVHMPLSRAVAGGSADPVSRVVNDPQRLGGGFATLLSKAVAQLTKRVAALIAAFVVNWRLTLLTLVIVPPVAILLRKLGKRIRRASRTALRRQAGLYRVAGETTRGLRVVKAFGTERREGARFHRENRGVLMNQLQVRTAQALAGPVVETLAIFVLAGLALVAVKAVNDGDLSPEEMIVAIAAVGVAGASLKPFTGMVTKIQQASAAADRIAETLDIKPERGREAGLPPAPRLGRSLRFERVTVTYPGSDAPAVRDVTLEIERGGTLALVGPNGSGKTTLLSLVPRLLDPDDDGMGRVLIDGVDIRTVSVRSLRRHIGLVTQETLLFEGTIAENIAYGSRGVTATRIEAAARKARAHEFIMEKGGYGAKVGEAGLTLSGGQRQRVAIARAILRDPAILLLDEATSMIDSESEVRIAEALAEFASERTTIVVAHRLSTVQRADRIAVLEAGGLVGFGTHAELLKRSDAYRSIARGQFADAAV